MKACIDNKSIGACDECNSQNNEHESDTVSSSESQGVLEDQTECIPSSCAEVLAGKSNLNVCVFTDEFDKSLKAVKKIASKTKENLYHLIFFGLIELCFIPFKDDSDKLYESNQE